MASIALLLSELLGGDSAGVLAAERYITGGGRLSPRDELLRPAVTEASAASPATRQKEQGPEKRDGEPLEDLAASRIEVDVMLASGLALGHGHGTRRLLC